MQAQNSAIIKGTVTDGENSLPGATVVLTPSNKGEITNLDGFFVLFNVPSGAYTLLVSYVGFQSHTAQIDIKPGEQLNLGNIVLLPNSEMLQAVEVKTNLERGSEMKAVNMMKVAPRITTVLSAEMIDKLPDKNAAETVRRLPGVAVNYNKGEGSFVSLRGTPTDWTSTLLNGNRLPVADEENVTRSFEFEVIPSELIEYVVVSQTSSPDMEGDNIGGSVNFITRSATDHRAFHINAGLGYNSLTQKPTVNIDFLNGNRSKDKRWGYVLNGSYYGRNYGAQAMRLVYGFNSNHGINRLELKDYDGFRHTIGGSAGVEFVPSNTFKIAAKGLFGTMIDDKYQRKTSYNYTEGSGARVRLQNIHGVLNRQLMGGELNLNWKPNHHWAADVQLASYQNRFFYGNVPYNKKDSRNGYYYTEFISPLLYYLDQDCIDFYGNPIDCNSPQKVVTKLLDLDNPYGHGDPYTNVIPKPTVPSSPDGLLRAEDFEFYQALSELNNTRETDPIVASLNLKHTVSNALKIQVGAKYRYKTGKREVGLNQWTQDIPIRSQPYKLLDFDTKPFDERGGYLPEMGSPYDDTFFPFLTKKAHQQFLSLLGDTLREYPMNKFNPEYRFWVGSTYEYTESVSAAYAMAQGTLGSKLDYTVGMRWELTNLYQKSDTLLDELAIEVINGTFYVYYVPEERITRLNYHAFLPSLNLIYHISPTNDLRFAVSRTFHRPDFSQTKPGAGAYRFDDLTITAGNSNLQPTYSFNLDAMYIHFWGNKGLFSIGGYYKYVTNHIFAVTTADVDNFGIILKRYENAETSFVAGTELNLQRKFDFLPGFLNGFGINANISYAYSQMKVPGRTKPQAMTEQTPWLFNAALFYEKYNIQTRIGFNYNGPHLHQLNLAAVQDLNGELALLHQDNSYDIFEGSSYMMDCQFSYFFHKNYSAFIEFSNLLNSPDRLYRGEPDRIHRIEYYRWRGQVGVKLTL